MAPMRIWYQSYVDYENGKTYWDNLRKHLADIVDDGTTVDVKGITPFDSYAHPLVEFRCAREMIANAITAEREGYDAFVVGHFQDAGLYEARSAVDIPVVALGEASMLYGCQLGQQLGIVTINPRFKPWFRHQIGKYGLQDRVTGVDAMTFEPGQILRGFEDPTVTERSTVLRRTSQALSGARHRRADPRRRHSHAVVRARAQSHGRRRTGHQRYSDCRKNG